MNLVMARCASRFIVFFCVLSTTAWADERVYFPSEIEERGNTRVKATTDFKREKSNSDNESVQPRFLPFAASFTLSSVGNPNNAHSLSIGGSPDGITLSQSASQASGSSGNHGSGISASHSSSFSAGLSGISAANGNAFNVNHPTFGSNSQANANSFALGQATASAQGNVVNGVATSGAQSGVGSASSGAGSMAGTFGSNNQGHGHRRGKPWWFNAAPNYGVGGSYGPNRRPDVGTSDRWQHQRPYAPMRGHRPLGGYHGYQQGANHNGNYQPFNHGPSGDRDSWTQGHANGPRPGSWPNSQRNEKPGLQISGASASSSATSNSPGSSAFGQSSSNSNVGPNGPISWTDNNVQTSGNAQSNAQGSSAAVEQNFHGNTQGSFSSGSIAGASTGNGYSQGHSGSGNRDGNSRGQVTSHATGTANVQGTANSGFVNFVRFPDGENPQNLPIEFLRNRQSTSVRDGQRRRNSKTRTRDPLGEIITDLSDTVEDIFDI